MNRILLTLGVIVMFALFTLVFASGAAAQHWTQEEQAVIDHVKMCHDAWAETVAQQDLTIWFDKCQPADDFAGWWVSDGALWNHEAERRTFPEWVKGVKRFSWENIQPLTVKIYDDVALIWFYVTFTLEDPAGKTTRIEEKRFEVLRRTDGSWHWIGAMVSAKENNW